jgi:hypothetical protein
MGGDDSDDDIGAPGNFADGNLGLDYNSDENDDDEQVLASGRNELIDLGSGGTSKAATNIPKLSGPN